MRIATRLPALALLLLAVQPCLAQFGGEGFGGGRMPGSAGAAYLITTQAGNRVVGSIGDTNVQVETDEFGTIRVPFSAIHSIALGAGRQGQDLIGTFSGSILQGKVEFDSIQVESDLGTLTIPLAKLKSVESQLSARGFGAGFKGFGELAAANRPAPEETPEHALQPAPATQAAPPREEP